MEAAAAAAAAAAAEGPPIWQHPKKLTVAQMRAYLVQNSLALPEDEGSRAALEARMLEVRPQKKVEKPKTKRIVKQDSLSVLSTSVTGPAAAGGAQPRSPKPRLHAPRTPRSPSPKNAAAVTAATTATASRAKRSPQHSPKQSFTFGRQEGPRLPTTPDAAATAVAAVDGSDAPAGAKLVPSASSREVDMEVDRLFLLVDEAFEKLDACQDEAERLVPDLLRSVRRDAGAAPSGSTKRQRQQPHAVVRQLSAPSEDDMRRLLSSEIDFVDFIVDLEGVGQRRLELRTGVDVAKAIEVFVKRYALPPAVYEELSVLVSGHVLTTTQRIRDLPSRAVSSPKTVATTPGPRTRRPTSLSLRGPRKNSQ